jgi:5-methylthioadenosine/S-adenosylhomocysteine deaminase
MRSVRVGRKLISAGQVVSVDPRIGTIAGDVLIDGDTIVAVGRVDPAETVGAEVLDATDMLVMPGFVDAHRHTWQSALRHRNGDRYGQDYFDEVLFRIAPHYSADDVYIGTLLGALGALDSGTTTLFDWAHIQNSPAHADAGIRALKESGLRAVFGHGHSQVDPVAWNVASSLPHTDDIRRIQQEHFAEPGLVTLAMSARGPEQTDDATWRADLELARELGLRTSMHAGVGDRGPAHRAVERMHRAGALGEDMTFLHLNTCSDDELAYIADAGATVSLGIQVEAVSHLGDIPTDRMLAAGLRPSLSGDTETMGTGDMFTQVRLALFEYRLKAATGRNAAGSPATMSTDEALSMGTQAGAESRPTSSWSTRARSTWLPSAIRSGPSSSVRTPATSTRCWWRARSSSATGSLSGSTGPSYSRPRASPTRESSGGLPDLGRHSQGENVTARAPRGVRRPGGAGAR